MVEVLIMLSGLGLIVLAIHLNTRRKMYVRIIKKDKFEIQVRYSLSATWVTYLDRSSLQEAERAAIALLKEENRKIEKQKTNSVAGLFSKPVSIDKFKKLQKDNPEYFI